VYNRPDMKLTSRPPERMDKQTARITIEAKGIGDTGKTVCFGRINDDRQGKKATDNEVAERRYHPGASVSWPRDHECSQRGSA
jgi:hypothetical protein